MDRREAIKRAALLMGGIVLTPAMLSSFQGCTPQTGSDWQPMLFDETQRTLAEQLAETLIPKTDTPGAIEAGVPSFIDKFVAEVYTQPEREQFLDGLASVNERAQEEEGSAFTELDAEARLRFATRLDEEALSTAVTTELAPAFFRSFKDLTVMGYCWSEPGATQHLRFSMNPGPFQGCVPFEEVGKTWAMS